MKNKQWKCSYYPVFLSIWKNLSCKWSLFNAHFSISSRDRLIRHLYAYRRGRRDYVNSIFPKKQNLTQDPGWETAYMINGYVCSNSNNYQINTQKFWVLLLAQSFKIVTVRFKDANLHTRGCKLMTHRMHLACRYVFYFHAILLFQNLRLTLKIWEPAHRMPDVQVLWAPIPCLALNERSSTCQLSL